MLNEAVLEELEKAKELTEEAMRHVQRSFQFANINPSMGQRIHTIATGLGNQAEKISKLIEK